MDIIDRFQKSLTQYNKAKSLLDKGGTAEAEKLLSDALTMYPREILMGGGPDINDELLDSYETLFTDIKVQLEVIKELRGDEEDDIPAPVEIEELEAEHPGSITSSSTYVSLQDIVMRNRKTGSASPPVDIPEATTNEYDSPNLEIITAAAAKEPAHVEPSALVPGKYKGDGNSLDPDDLVAELKMHDESELESEGAADPEYVIDNEPGELNEPETSLDDEYSGHESSPSIIEKTEEGEPGEEENEEETVTGDTEMERNVNETNGEEEIDYEALAKAAEDNGEEEVMEEEDALPAPKPMSAPAQTQQSAGNDDEALLSDEEVREDMGLEDKKSKKKKREKKERRPVVLPDMSKFINAALLIIGLVALAGSAYFGITEFNKLTIPDRIISRATMAFENGNIGEATAALSELQLTPGWKTEAGSFAVASLIAGWGQTLINEKKVPQATQLLSGAFTSGTKSQILIESLLDTIISGGEAAGPGAPDRVQKDLNMATRIITAGGLNPVASSAIQKRMGSLAYDTFSRMVKNCVVNGDGIGAYNGLKNIQSFQKVLSPENADEAAVLMSKTAVALEKNAADDFKKKNFADASRHAGMALELSPSLKDAKRTKTIADGKL